MKPFLIWYLYSGLMIFSAQLPAQLSKDSPQSATAEKPATLCANMSETSIPSIPTATMESVRCGKAPEIGRSFGDPGCNATVARNGAVHLRGLTLQRAAFKRVRVFLSCCEGPPLG